MRTPDFSLLMTKFKKPISKEKNINQQKEQAEDIIHVRVHSTCTGTQYMYPYSVHSTCMYEYCIRFFTTVLNFLKCKKMKENVGISKHKAQSTCTIHMNATVILVA